MNKSQIAVIGLGTMGANLAQNIINKGWNTTVYNRHWDKTEAFVEAVSGERLIMNGDQAASSKEDSSQIKPGTVLGARTIQELVESLEKPRKILLMIPSGSAIDEMSAELKPYLESGDIIIDGGNSYYRDTVRREQEFASHPLSRGADLPKANQGVYFVGCGVSGGHAGALKGPSMMFGGYREAWEQTQEILKTLAARDFNNQPCIAYLGNSGAGHAVKMVHNGIEYAIMQLFAETYHLLKQSGKSMTEIAETFASWNTSKLNGYLCEISAKVSAKTDEFSDTPLVEHIQDIAKQKGTGKWTSQAGLEWNVPLPSITAAVETRFHSEQKTEREILSKLYPVLLNAQRSTLSASLESSLHFLTLCIFAQGIELLEQISKNENLAIDIDESLRVWQGGCIIRMGLLKDLQKAYRESQEKQIPLLATTFFQSSHQESSQHIQQTLSALLESHTTAPCHFATHNWFLQKTTNPLFTNFIQGMRDYFGAHTYERTDREGTFTTDWNS